jgi:rod shape-determining protein MreD
VKVVWVLLAMVAAVALQSSIDRWLRGGGIDLVLIVVVYSALTSGRVSGMLTGSFAGLVQDALSGGVLGMGGLSKTVVGYLVGVVSTQFIVTHTLTRFVVFFLATALNALVFMGLYELLGLRHFGVPYAAVAGQGVLNAVVGVLTFKAVELLPGAVERRRLARSSFRR